MDSFATSIYSGFVVAVLLLVAAVAYLFWRLNKKNRRYFDNYAAKMIDVLEKERQRIGADLHDELVPSLAVSMMMITEKLKQEPKHKAWSDKVNADLKNVTERMRGIVLCLRSPSLQKGLGVALLDHINVCQQLYNIPISFHYDITESGDAEFNIQVYRMVQELIQNALKHAEASQLVLSLRRRKDRLILEFSDNGKGIEPELIRTQHRRR